jgi:HNH endonuclease
VGNRLVQKVMTRRGLSSLVASLIYAMALAGTSAGGFAIMVASLLLGAGTIWILALVWESKTLPATPTYAKRPAAASASRMLREDANAKIVTDRGGYLFERRYFVVATGLPPVRITPSRAAEIEARRHSDAVRVVDIGHRVWWVHGDVWCWENCGYSPEDVRALLTERARRHHRKLGRAHAMMAADGLPAQSRRQHIPTGMRQIVYERDGGRCVECTATFDLQYDHIIPIAMGGATSTANLQLLCAPCNQAKSATLG